MPPILIVDRTLRSTGIQTDGGNLVSGLNTLTPSVDEAGTYSLTIENLTNGCSATASTFLIDSTNTIMANINGLDSLTCNNLPLTLDASGSTNGPNISQTWATSDGNILSPNTEFSIEIDAPGTYNLAVVDTFTDCFATASLTIIDNVIPPVAEAGDSIIINCNTTIAALTGLGSSTGSNFNYQWSGPGPITNAQSLNATTNQPGIYFLTVTNTQNGCFAIDSVVVTENFDTPIITNSIGGTISCLNPTVDLEITVNPMTNDLIYAWNGPGISDTTTTNILTTNTPGIYDVSVINTVSQCLASIEILIPDDTLSPIADAGINQTISCNRPLIDLGGPNTSLGPDFAYNWFTNEGNISGPIDQATTQADTSGVYGLIVRNNQNGCTDTSFVTILNALSLPLADAGGDRVITCASTTLELDGSNSATGPEFTYNWTGPCVQGISNLSTVTVDCEDIYVLQVENTNTGCINTDTSRVTRAPDIPNAILPDSAFISCINGTATLDGSASGGGTVDWFFEDGTSLNTNGLTPTIDLPGNLLPNRFRFN